MEETIRAYPTLKPPPSPDFGLGEGGGLRVRGGLKNLRFGTQNPKKFRAPAALRDDTKIMITSPVASLLHPRAAMIADLVKMSERMSK